MIKDKTDILTYMTVAGLAVFLLVLMIGHSRKTVVEGRALGRMTFSNDDQEETILRNYLGHYPPVPGDLESLETFAEVNPDNSRVFVFLGEFYKNEGKLAEATYNYRRALENNRGYVDKTSEIYMGNILEELVEQGMKIYLREKELRPEDKNVRKVIKDLYFIRRTMAQGCD